MPRRKVDVQAVEWTNCGEDHRVFKRLIAALTAFCSSGVFFCTFEARGETWTQLVVEQQTRVESLEIAARSGRFEQLRIFARNGPIYLREVRVVFGDQRSRVYKMNQRIRENGSSDRIDLPGRASTIRRVELEFDGRGRPAIDGLIADGRSGFEVLETALLRTDDRTVRFRPLSGEGRIGAIRLRAAMNGVLIRRADITFRNGDTQRVQIRQRVGVGEVTPAIDLRGRRRRVRQIILTLRPQQGPVRRARIDLLGTKRSGRRDEPTFVREWRLLGSQRAQLFSQDDDMFRVESNRGPFSRIHVRARRQDIRMYGMTVVFRNGDRQSIPLFGRVRDGERTADFDLEGGRRYIDRVLVRYRTRLSLRGEGILELWGEEVRRSRPNRR